MRRVGIRPFWAAALIACAGLNAGSAFGQGLKCEVGPVAKTYGSATWLVYGCGDSKNVLLVAPPGNPATPFYFLLVQINGVYRVAGRGAGDKSATTNAENELKRLSESDIAALIEETRTGNTEADRHVPSR